MLQLATNPNVPQASPVLGDDIDALGALRAKLAALEREEKALADSIKSRLIARGKDAVAGHAYVAGVTVAERVTLDGKAAEALLVEHGLDVPRKSSIIESLRIVRLA